MTRVGVASGRYTAIVPPGANNKEQEGKDLRNKALTAGLDMDKNLTNVDRVWTMARNSQKAPDGPIGKVDTSR